MFTGMIDHCGVILDIKIAKQSLLVWIESQFSNVVLGESIAIDGICLTVTQVKGSVFSCDISPETLALTTAKNFSLHQRVNLERALQLSSRVGGHFVSGHIDQIVVVKSIHKKDDFLLVELTGVHSSSMSLLSQKGSVAINGVSLTINSVTDNGLNLMLIPHTLEKTNLGLLSIEQPVNIEFDMIARIVAQQCKVYREE